MGHISGYVGHLSGDMWDTYSEIYGTHNWRYVGYKSGDMCGIKVEICGAYKWRYVGQIILY